MYKVSYKNLISKAVVYIEMLFFGIMFFLIIKNAIGLKNLFTLGILFYAVPLIPLVIAVFSIVKIIKTIIRLKKLNKVGVLYKNVPYVLESTGTKLSGVRLRKPIVDFELPGGVITRLEGDTRRDKKRIEKRGYIDLLIDPNDPNNNYMEFNINRIEGNRPEDFYKSTKQENNEKPL